MDRNCWRKHARTHACARAHTHTYTHFGRCCPAEAFTLDFKLGISHLLKTQTKPHFTSMRNTPCPPLPAKHLDQGELIWEQHGAETVWSMKPACCMRLRWSLDIIVDACEQAAAHGIGLDMFFRPEQEIQSTYILSLLSTCLGLDTTRSKHGKGVANAFLIHQLLQRCTIPAACPPICAPLPSKLSVRDAVAAVKLLRVPRGALIRIRPVGVLTLAHGAVHFGI